MKIKTKTLSRNDRCAVRLPNWLGDICMVLPALKAMLKKSKAVNPNVKYTIFVQKQYISFLQEVGVEGELVPLPDKGLFYYLNFLPWCWKFDAYTLFTNSERGDLEAWFTGARRRYGISRPHKHRRLLTDKYQLEDGFDEQKIHQSELWSKFLKSFGLIDEVDYSPLIKRGESLKQVGLICGSSNSPEKRWPVAYWQNLIPELMNLYDEVLLLGTSADATICNEIQSKFTGIEKVKSLVGKTKLCELARMMSCMELVIGNDTGGLHIANAMGVPVVGLYGVTNATKCKPAYKSPIVIIESEKSFKEGSMVDIDVNSVLKGAIDVTKLSL